MPVKYEDYAGPCVWCGSEVGLTREHVFPAALGGTLEVKAVCGSCNSKFGSEIDWHLQVVYARTMLDLGLIDYVLHAERGDPFKRWRLYRDGRIEQAEPSSSKAQAGRRRLVSSGPSGADGARESLYEVASSRAWERLASDAVAQAASEGKSARVHPLEVTPRPATIYPVSGTGREPTERLYNRALAKVALNAVVWACGPAVLGSSQFDAAKDFVRCDAGGGVVTEIPGSDGLRSSTRTLAAELLPYSDVDGTSSVVIDLFHSVRIYRVAVASGGPVGGWEAQVVLCESDA